MKKSVLIALLGLTSVEGMRLNQREVSHQTSGSANEASLEDNKSNASNATKKSLSQNTSNASNASAASFAQNSSNGSNATAAAFVMNSSNASNATAAAFVMNSSNASNVSATAFVGQDFDLVRALVEVDAKQDELDHENEMAMVDKEAEEEANK